MYPVGFGVNDFRFGAHLIFFFFSNAFPSLLRFVHFPSLTSRWHSIILSLILFFFGQTKHVQFIFGFNVCEAGNRSVCAFAADSNCISTQHLLNDDRCCIIMTFFGYFSVRVNCVSLLPFWPHQLVSKRVHFCVRCLMKCAPCR